MNLSLEIHGRAVFPSALMWFGKHEEVKLWLDARSFLKILELEKLWHFLLTQKVFASFILDLAHYLAKIWRLWFLGVKRFRYLWAASLNVIAGEKNDWTTVFNMSSRESMWNVYLHPRNNYLYRAPSPWPKSSN